MQLTDEQQTILATARDRFGARNQIVHAMQESAEYQVELSKFICGGFDRHKLMSEMADNRIMEIHVMEILEIYEEDLKPIIDAKINRLK